MGRHTTPGTGTAAPDRGFWVRLAVAGLAVVLAGGYLVLRLTGGDDGVTTAATPTGSATGSGPATGTAASSAPAGGPAPSASSPPAAAASTPAPAAATTRPPTLSFTVRYPAYITVRVPGGVTLVSKLFGKGAKASFDKKRLQVVNGRPDAVRFVVNGRPRKPGPSGQTEVFTVRRR